MAKQIQNNIQGAVSCLARSLRRCAWNGSLPSLVEVHTAASPPQAAEPLWQWSSVDCTRSGASLPCCESSMGLVPQGCPCSGMHCPRLQVPLECLCCGVGCLQATFCHGCSCPTVVMMVIIHYYYYFSCCYSSFKAGWFWSD